MNKSIYLLITLFLFMPSCAFLSKPDSLENTRQERIAETMVDFHMDCEAKLVEEKKLILGMSQDLF